MDWSRLKIIGMILWGNLLIGMSPAFAQIQPEFRLLDHLEYWEDQRQAATLDEIRTGTQEWIVNPSGKAPTFGFSRSAFWFRFQLPASIVDHETLILLFRYPLTDDIQLHMPAVDGGYKVLKAGRNYPIASRTLETQDLTLEIPLDHQLPDRFFYIRVQTQGSAQFPMDILSFHEYFKYSYRASLPYRIFMGAMLIMILFNIIFYLVTRLTTYLVYVSFIVCSTLFVMSVYWPIALAAKRDIDHRQNAGGEHGLHGSDPYDRRIGQHEATHRHAAGDQRVDREDLIGDALGGLQLQAHVVEDADRGDAQQHEERHGDLVEACPFRPEVKIGQAAYFFFLSVGSLAFWAVIYGLKTFGILPHNLITESSAMFASISQITLLTFALADQHREIQKQNTRMQKEMISMQQENIRFLDQKVEEKTRDVRVILNSIQQGIFTISGQPPTIDEEYSRHLANLFPGAGISGRDPMDLLGTGSQLSGDETAQLRSAILCSLDSDLCNFELNEALFPRRLVLQEDRHRRILEVEWSPVLRKDESVGKILVALRDVTHILELEEQKKRIDADFHLMNLVLLQKPERVRHFIRFNRRLLERIREQSQHSDRTQLKGLLHTLKGNARTFGLGPVSNICHQLEDFLRAAHAEMQDCLQGFNRIEAILDDLNRAADHVQTSSAQEQRQTQEIIRTSLQSLRIGRPAKDTAQMLAGLVYRELQGTVKGLESSLDGLARELKMPVPELHYTQPTAIFLEENFADLLQSLLVHLLTNAMTHGIESASERLQKGKATTGSIRVTAGLEDQEMILSIADDGRGLPMEALRTRAIQQGVLDAAETDPQRIAESIFAAGVSTTDQISLHAGRGVGMTAVRHMLQSLGTDIALILHSAPSDPWQAISFTMRFPLAADPLLVRVAS